MGARCWFIRHSMLKNDWSYALFVAYILHKDTSHFIDQSWYTRFIFDSSWLSWIMILHLAIYLVEPGNTFLLRWPDSYFNNKNIQTYKYRQSYLLSGPHTQETHNQKVASKNNFQIVRENRLKWSSNFYLWHTVCQNNQVSKFFFPKKLFDTVFFSIFGFPMKLISRFFFLLSNASIGLVISLKISMQHNVAHKMSMSGKVASFYSFSSC